MTEIKSRLVRNWNELIALESNLDSKFQKKIISGIDQQLSKLDEKSLTPEEKALACLIESRILLYNEKFNEAEQLASDPETVRYFERFASRNNEDIGKARVGSKIGDELYDRNWMHTTRRNLEENLGRINKQGEEYLPSEELYNNWQGTDDYITRVALDLMAWLGIEPHKQTIFGYAEIEPPGLFTWPEGMEVIIINSKYRSDPYKSVAILAHEMMHLYLSRKEVGYLKRDDNERLTDIATIEAGFGVLVLNGMYFNINWWYTILMLLVRRIAWSYQSISFGYFKGKQYGAFYKNYLKGEYSSLKPAVDYIHPNSMKFIGRFTNIFSPVPYIRKLALKHSLSSGLPLALIGTVLVLAAFSSSSDTASGTSSQVTSSNQAQSTPAIDQKKSEYQQCVSEYQSMSSRLDTLNSTMDNYKTYDDTDSYNSLVPEQNQLAKALNSKQSECETIRTTANNLIDEHNSQL